MPFYLIREDITTVRADAIVNAAKESLLGGGGVDGAIHRAAGPELVEECRGLGGCRPGEAKLTGAYRLPARWVIHTVGPRWRGGQEGEEEILRACYRNSLSLALSRGCASVVFPLISAGVFGYPKAEALRVAEEEILRFLVTAEMTVYLTVLSRGALDAAERFPELAELLGGTGRPVTGGGPLAFSKARKPLGPFTPAARRPRREELAAEAEREEADNAVFSAIAAPASVPEELAGELEALDESFSEMLLRKITEKGMTDAECYRKANIDRKHFSKIRSDRLYRPGKPTVLAFAVALELSLEETRELLMKAGFALSRSSKFDVIVEYFISRGEYDIFRINDALFAFDQLLLGC